MTYDNNNRGALFQNKEKKTTKSPDYSGQAEINNVKMLISGWRQTSSKGLPYISLSFSLPQDGAKPKAEKPTTSSVDDIPF